MHTGGTMNTEKLGVRLEVPTFLLKSQLSQVWLKCDSSVYSEGKKNCKCDYTQLWHFFTFGRYLWRYLHLVVFAPLLPVPPLFFWQGRRHADQTGDRLPGAGLKTDVRGCGGKVRGVSRAKQHSNVCWLFPTVLLQAQKLTCSEGF